MEHERWIASGEASRDEQERASLEATRAALPDIARLLHDTFGATEVVVFGSFGPGGTPGPHSDVDLLVRGLDTLALMRATARLMHLLGRPVDLVPAEQAGTDVVHEARCTGRVLHGP